MKNYPLILSRLALALLGATLISSCASPLESRIVSNPQIYSSLSNSDKVLVNQGHIREGMTKEAVFMAWGRADRVSRGSKNGTSIEQWTYLGTEPVFTESYGIGFSSGWNGRYGGRYGYRYGGGYDPFWSGSFGPSVTYIPYKAASVDFRGNRVTSYSGPAE